MKYLYVIVVFLVVMMSGREFKLIKNLSQTRKDTSGGSYVLQERTKLLNLVAENGCSVGLSRDGPIAEIGKRTART